WVTICVFYPLFYAHQYCGSRPSSSRFSPASNGDYRNSFGYFIMGNKPAKQERREEVLLKIVPPLDQAYVRWLARDIERIHSFSPRNPRAVKPPEHYIVYMQLNGWLDVDLDDPDLAHLFK
ncbi:hypothetical protein V6Z12_A07G129100, partial [Gossypium hirsutum]